MMKLIVGLGNPGRKFAKTRHNVGHMFVAAFSEQLTPVPEHRSTRAELGTRQGSSVRGAAANSKAVRSKPKAVCRRTTGFMNDSGKEVKKLLTINHLPFTRLLVVHDDMDLPLGEFKLQFGRSAAGHKGVQSVIDALGTRDFWRLRIGIGKPPAGVPGDKFVLEKLTPKEFKILQGTLAEAYPHVLEWIGT